MSVRTLSLVALIVSVFISTLTFATTTPLLPVRLAARGFSERMALGVLSTVAVGNVALQAPIGMLADPGGAERLLAALSTVGLAGLLLMPMLAPMGMLRWPFLFVWAARSAGSIR